MSTQSVQDRLLAEQREFGWDITALPTVGPFYWGARNRAKTSGRE